MSIIEFNNVTYTYKNGFTALKDLSFSIDIGENIALIGQNGAGKTTTAKMINGLLKPTMGFVMIDGKNTKDYTTASLSKIAGYVFQNPDEQIFHNTIKDEIAFGPKVLNFSKEYIDKQVSWAIKLCDLTDFADENPYNLPLSTRKFVQIASVLAMDTKIIILDEPTAGQDLIGIKRLENILKELNNKKITTITITHDMEFVSCNFDKIFVMANQQLLKIGTSEQIFTDDDLLEKSMLKKPYIIELASMLNLKNITKECELINYFSKK